MEQQPLVSVIMPSYQAERYIADSIMSVFRQTYSNWELLITDDCSSDRTPEIAQSFSEKDARVKFHVAEKHTGIANTRNQSLRRAQGRFIAFLDNDDLWVPEKLEKQVNFLLQHNYSFCYSAYELIQEDGTPKGKTIRTAGIVDYRKYLRNTIIGSGTILLDREKIPTVTMPCNATSDDMALWCKILKEGHLAYPIDEVLMQYRVRSDSASANKWKAAKDVWKVYRQEERLTWLDSVFCFVGYAFNAVKKRLF